MQISLSTTIFDQLVSCLIDEIVVQLEKAVFKSTFNRVSLQSAVLLLRECCRYAAKRSPISFFQLTELRSMDHRASIEQDPDFLVDQTIDKTLD